MTPQPTSTVERWTARIKAAFPHLPDHLSAEMEEERLDTLQPWIDRVRAHWGERAEPGDPVLAGTNPLRTLDQGQMGAVLGALDEGGMAPEEERAWHVARV